LILQKNYFGLANAPILGQNQNNPLCIFEFRAHVIRFVCKQNKHERILSRFVFFRAMKRRLEDSSSDCASSDSEDDSKFREAAVSTEDVFKSSKIHKNPTIKKEGKVFTPRPNFKAVLMMKSWFSSSFQFKEARVSSSCPAKELWIWFWPIFVEAITCKESATMAAPSNWLRTG